MLYLNMQERYGSLTPGFEGGDLEEPSQGHFQSRRSLSQPCLPHAARGGRGRSLAVYYGQAILMFVALWPCALTSQNGIQRLYPLGQL
jgi:hypothetical protein